jgi:site-specific recombinase XerD
LVKSGINKQVSIHSLRHSFATHLMENGTEIRYIQELLGHSSIRTTERYTHVAKRDVLKVKSPLDML